MSTSRSSRGARPAACTSLSSGSEILPSGRTGMVRLMAVLFHTAISSRSSGPIRYSPSAAAIPTSPFGGSSAAASPVTTSEIARTMVTTCLVIVMIPSSCGLRRHHRGAVHVRRDAAPQEVDRHHEQAPVRLDPYENAFHVRQRPARDPHPLALLQEGVRQGGDPRLDDPPDRVDLPVGNRRQLIPALTQDLDQPPRFHDLHVARLVHRGAQGDVAPEPRY